MKLPKNIYNVFLGLSLVLSLVSFSGVANQPTKEAIKTALVVNDFKSNKARSFHFNNVNKEIVITILEYSVHSFKIFQRSYNSKEYSNFNDYSTCKNWVKANQLHSKVYPNHIHKTLYQNFVV